jgi:hypothetical protein
MMGDLELEFFEQFAGGADITDCGTRVAPTLLFMSASRAASGAHT